MNAQHLSLTENWGTPPPLIRLERQTMGRIDLDPASDEEWNFSIGAARYIDKATDGLKTPWTPGAPAPDRVLDEHALRAEAGWSMTVHVNPPGDKKGRLVAAFWRALTGYFALGWVTSACYVGFSLEQSSRLQRVGARFSPLSCVTLVPDERVPYMVTRTLQSSQPGHASFLSLLSHSRIERERFCDLGTELGEVVIPYRRKSTRV